MDITESMNKEGDMAGHLLSLDDLFDRIPKKVVVATGMVHVPPDMLEDMPQSVKDNDIIDVMLLGLTTVDDTKHEFLLQPDEAIRIGASIIKWIESLHEQGKCGCEDHEG